MHWRTPRNRSRIWLYARPCPLRPRKSDVKNDLHLQDPHACSSFLVSILFGCKNSWELPLPLFFLQSNKVVFTAISTRRVLSWKPRARRRRPLSSSALQSCPFFFLFPLSDVFFCLWIIALIVEIFWLIWCLPRSHLCCEKHHLDFNKSNEYSMQSNS